MKYFDLTIHLTLQKMPIISVNYHLDKPHGNDNEMPDIISVNECREIMETARDVSVTFKTYTVFNRENLIKVRRLEIKEVK